ncbi:MAG TPA: hypothetical protein P5511_02410, partial [Candidatus Goldiibacteriota bacterium]|nr:hypothetical protein [Candidatus Goldiibacteriota bacterium]
MKKTARDIVSLLLPAGDAVAIGLAVISAYYARFFLPVIEVRYGIPEFRYYLAAVPVIAVVFMLSMNYAGLYLQSAIRARIDSFFKVLASLTAGTVILLAATFFIRSFTFSRVVMVFLLGLAVIYVYAWRLAYRAVYDSLARRGVIIRKLLVLGATTASGLLIDRLGRDLSAGYRVAGCVDNRLKKGAVFHGVKVLGKVREATGIIEKTGADEVFIGMTDYNRKETAEIILKNDNVKFMIASDILGLMTKSIEYDEMFGIPVFSVGELPLDKP